MCIRDRYNTARQVGSVLGVALVGMVLAGGEIADTAGWAVALPLGAMLVGALASVPLRARSSAAT